MEEGYNYEDIEEINIHKEYDYDHVILKIFYSWRNFKEISLAKNQCMKLLEYAENLDSQKWLLPGSMEEINELISFSPNGKPLLKIIRENNNGEFHVEIAEGVKISEAAKQFFSYMCDLVNSCVICKEHGPFETGSIKEGAITNAKCQRCGKEMGIEIANNQ